MADFTFSPFPFGPIVEKDGNATAGVRGYFGQFDQSPESILIGRGNDVTKDIGTLQRITIGDGLSLDGTELSALNPDGDVAGPSSAIDNDLAAFDGVTGKILKDSSVLASWFNQSLRTTASPTFAGLTVNGFAFTVSGAPTLGNWFDQSVKVAASPTFAGLTVSGGSISVNGSTVTVSGACTLDNWFDQSVKTSASPTFAGLTVNSHVVTVNGAVTLDNWFDQSVKTTANPVFNSLHISATARADTGFAYGTTPGDTFTGLSVALTGGGSSLSFDILGGIMCNGVLTI